jgi:hypothetical protein
MKLNRFAAGVIALGIAAAAGAGPANAATVTATGANIVVVKWSTVATASLAVNADYVLATGVTAGAGGTIITSGNPAPAAGGACVTGGTGGSPTGNVLDFGAITPDQSAALQCLYEKAVVAKVVTNSTSWTLTQEMGSAVPAGFTLCPVPGANQTALPLTYTAPTSASLANTCSGTPVTGAGFTAYTTGSAAGTFYAPEDLGLIVAANAAVTTEAGINLVLQLVAN